MSADRGPVGPAAGTEGTIGVGAVGVRLGEGASILEELPGDGRFRLVVYSDEGLPPVPRPEEEADAEAVPGEAEPPAIPCCSDYNVLLRDPAAELILVDGPVELRRDFAVRALNAGRHVVLAAPFCETALDAERVAKTALRKGLVATMELKWRDDADLRAIRAALDAENVPTVQGAFAFWNVAEAAPSGTGLLAQLGMSMLDQMRFVLREDVRSVNAHLLHPGPDAADAGFLLYMPVRSGGWAVCHAARNHVAEFPRWALYTARAAFAAGDGSAVVSTGGQTRTYRAPGTPQGFWDNLYAAVREGADLKCHPADIVHAMKLHEAALESAESGEAVTV